MQTPTPTDNASLEHAIKELEMLQTVQKNDLRAHFEQTKEALNPANLFKDGVKEAFHSSSFQTTAAKSLLSLGLGYLTKKLIVGDSPGAFRKTVGTLAQTGATGYAFKNSDLLATKGAPLLSRLLKKIKIGN